MRKASRSLRFVAPTTTELESKDDELASGGVAKLWVGLQTSTVGTAVSLEMRSRRIHGLPGFLS